MKKKAAVCLIPLVALLLTSCGDKTLSSEIVLESSQTIQIESSDITTDKEVGAASDSEILEKEEIGGLSPNACMAHTFSYHSIIADLINYVGKERGNEWADAVIEGSNDPYYRIGEDMTILAFIQEFDIPKETFIEITRAHITDGFLDMLKMTREEYYEEFGYTDEQIDALYSGDQDAVERAFCGPLAFVNEADQKVYSIYWLANHAAEDYLTKQIPLASIEELIETKAVDQGRNVDILVEKIEPQLERARELEKAAAAK